jgi:hypothetical protein
MSGPRFSCVAFDSPFDAPISSVCPTPPRVSGRVNVVTSVHWGHIASAWVRSFCPTVRRSYLFRVPHSSPVLGRVGVVTSVHLGLYRQRLAWSRLSYLRGPSR